MLSPRPANETCIWSSIRERAIQRAASEPMLASFLHATVLNHERFEDAISFHLAENWRPAL